MFGRGVAVLDDDTPDHVFVDLHSEGVGDLLGDSATAKARIALLEFNDSLG